MLIATFVPSWTYRLDPAVNHWQEFGLKLYKTCTFRENPLTICTTMSTWSKNQSKLQLIFIPFNGFPTALSTALILRDVYSLLQYTQWLWMSGLVFWIPIILNLPGLPPAEIIHVPNRIRNHDGSDELRQCNNHEQPQQILKSVSSIGASPICDEQPGKELAGIKVSRLRCYTSRWEES